MKETESALQTIELLKQYKSAKTKAKKDSILKKIDKTDEYVSLLLEQNIAPEELITKITKAISLDKYRPKNLPFILFAMDKDLDYINGDFDTFDQKLNHMVKNKENPEKIREEFKTGITNIYMLAKQFSADWMRRLSNHKDLVDTARKVEKENLVDAKKHWVNNKKTAKNYRETRIIVAYNKLFNALTKDFCNDHDCIIDTKLVKDWTTSDKKPYDLSVSGFQSRSYSLKIPKSTPEAKIKKIKEDFIKNYENHPNSRKESSIRINFRDFAYNNKPENLFYVLMSVFAHEMHHALDFQQPRQGALGPQIEQIDEKIYVTRQQNQRAYYASATEISSYIIQQELLNQLKKTRF